MGLDFVGFYILVVLCIIGFVNNLYFLKLDSILYLNEKYFWSFYVVGVMCSEEVG